jgi:hypothetical protein
MIFRKESEVGSGEGATGRVFAGKKGRLEGQGRGPLRYRSKGWGMQRLIFVAAAKGRPPEGIRPAVVET